MQYYGIELDSIDALRCPRCRSDPSYLHQGTVIVFDPPDKPVVIGQQARLPGRNPSDEREGLVIDFSCEDCGDGLQLTIAQHEGCTQIGWRY